MLTKKLFGRVAAMLAVVALPAFFTSCGEDKPDNPESTEALRIDQADLVKSIDKNGGKIEINVYTTLAKNQWKVEYTGGWISANQGNSNDGVALLTLTVQANSTNVERTSTVTVSGGGSAYDIQLTQYGGNDFEVAGDFRVKVTGGKASSVQSGSGNFSNSYDDNPSTMYHSNWDTPNRFPVTLEYYLAGAEDVDYVDYLPRQDSHPNGNFGEVTISVATDAARQQYEKVGDYDFGKKGSATRVTFPKSVKATAVKFEVKSGGGGFASCAEMRFWRKNTDKSTEQQLLTVFTDLTCSQLRSDVTDEKIAALDSYFFRKLANDLRTNSYDEVEKMIRIHEYEPYSNPEEWAVKLMTKVYSNLDNPMGIHAKKGDKVIVCVGPTHGHNVSIVCIGENTGEYAIPAASGTTYMVSEGINQLDITSDGQLFFMYTAEPSEPKIKVHIPLSTGDNGYFAGYFDLQQHKTDAVYDKIMAKATHKYFVVKGERMMFMFHRNSMKCRSMVSAITTWDQIVKWQQDFMGIDDVRPSQWNNHLMGVSMEGSYMWASDYRMGFVNTYLPNILEYDNLMAKEDNAWGPSHEMGHVNQKAINWMSTTESSNNLFSNYVLYQFGKYKSRGKGLMYRFEDVYVHGQSWVNMGCHDKTYQGEDTEIHMRMNWQLWNYFHRVMKDEGFFKRVFQNMRKVGLDETSDPGRKQLEYAKACSDAAQRDLTDFFEAWGFFKPCNTTIEQYGTSTYVVTSDMIAKAKAYMAQYPKPDHALEYIEDRQVADFTTGDYRYDTVGDVGYIATYLDNKKLAGGISASINGRTVNVKNGKEAVAFEVREVKNDVAGAVRYASNFLSFSIPAAINLSGTALYAVQADGTRVHLGNF